MTCLTSSCNTCAEAVMWLLQVRVKDKNLHILLPNLSSTAAAHTHYSSTHTATCYSSTYIHTLLHAPAPHVPA